MKKLKKLYQIRNIVSIVFFIHWYKINHRGYFFIRWEILRWKNNTIYFFRYIPNIVVDLFLNEKKLNRKVRNRIKNKKKKNYSSILTWETSSIANNYIQNHTLTWKIYLKLSKKNVKILWCEKEKRKLLLTTKIELIRKEKWWKISVLKFFNIFKRISVVWNRALFYSGCIDRLKILFNGLNFLNHQIKITLTKVLKLVYGKIYLKNDKEILSEKNPSQTIYQFIYF